MSFPKEGEHHVAAVSLVNFHICYSLYPDVNIEGLPFSHNIMRMLSECKGNTAHNRFASTKLEFFFGTTKCLSLN